MAYGFDTPATFGKFFPDGEFAGYEDFLEGYFEEASAEGQTTQKFFTDFRSDLHRDFHKGRRSVPDALLPKTFQLAKPYKKLGDIMGLGYASAVPSSLLDIIEKLEPGRHQSWPIDITLPSGDGYPIQYHMLNVLTSLDAWDKEQSDPGSYKKSMRIFKMLRPKQNYASGIALSREVIGDHHIWRGFVSPETGISGFNFYVSDALKEAIDKAGLITPPFYQLKEV